MNRFFLVVAALALVFVIGCGGGKDNLGLKRGERLVVTERIERARFEASYGENPRAISETDGAFVDIPAGTIMEVLITPRVGQGSFEVIPVQATVQVRDEETEEMREITLTEAEDLRNHFVPERYLRHNFQYYSFSFPADYLGAQLKKIAE